MKSLGVRLAVGCYVWAALMAGTAAADSMRLVSAASYAPGAVAAESIVAGFGSGLAAAEGAATAGPLPTSLGGVRVRVRDSLGVERFAPLLFVSPGQVNFQVPSGTAPGMAMVTLTSADHLVVTELLPIVAVAPGLFAANGNGEGAAAADRKSTRLNSSHIQKSRMPSSA